MVPGHSEAFVSILHTSCPTLQCHILINLCFYNISRFDCKIYEWIDETSTWKGPSVGAIGDLWNKLLSQYATLWSVAFYSLSISTEFFTVALLECRHPGALKPMYICI
jgi:hypothetical protein